MDFVYITPMRRCTISLFFLSLSLTAEEEVAGLMAVCVCVYREGDCP